MNAPTFDFDGLTGNQRALLMLGGWNAGENRTCPSAETVDMLLQRGLLQVRYDVPQAVALAWRKYLDAEMRAAPARTLCPLCGKEMVVAGRRLVTIDGNRVWVGACCAGRGGA